MPKPSAQVTAAEISRIAGVTRATISNWRRRHDDFPAPGGGTEGSPLYDLEAVRAWLRKRGQSAAATPAEELRTLLRLRSGGTVSRLLPLVLGASRHAGGTPDEPADLPEGDLVTWADSAAAKLADVVPDSAAARFGPEDVPVLRALVRCVREQGGGAALDVLAERELEDSAAGGTYSTPPAVAELMASLLPTGTARVLDPACGSGTLLEAATRRGATAVFGQDAVPVQAQRSAVRLLLAAPDAEVSVRTGDSLRADAFPDTSVDGVLCNPPYADRDWGHEELAYDPRWVYGLPARAESELAWVQHALAHLEPGGRAVLLLPPAVASRPSGRRVRTQLVRSGALRAVVGLPPGAAPPLHIGLQIWIVQQPQADAGHTSVLFVDMSSEGEDARSQSTHGSRGTTTRGRRRQPTTDWDELTAAVLDRWTAFTSEPDSSTVDQPGVARAVPLIDLVDELVDLTPARQVRTAPVDADPTEVAAAAEDFRKQLAESATALGEASQHSPWLPADGTPGKWRTAAISDLTRGGALDVLRPSSQAQEGERQEWRKTHSDRGVLTGEDIAHDARPSGDLGRLSADTSPLVEEGDVLVRGLVGGAGPMTRVADAEDAGTVLGDGVFLLRPDPARLDPWFLAGFLDAAANIAGASTGSTTVHVQPGRLRVPLVPLDEQRRYGETFRHIRTLRAVAGRAADLAHETARTVTSGLTAGALIPPRPDDSA